MASIKVQILLPLFYNPDENNRRREIEPEKFTETFDELANKFGGYSVNQDIINGEWIDQDTDEKFDDQNISCWIICEDTQENIDFLIMFKGRLMGRFEQRDIMMYYVTVNRL